MPDPVYNKVFPVLKSAGIQLSKDVGKFTAWTGSFVALFYGLESLGVFEAAGTVEGFIKTPTLVAEIHNEVFSPDGSSKVSSLLTSTKNIQERVSRLESSDAVAFDSDLVARYEANLDGSNVRVNKAYSKLLGTGISELMGFGWRNYVSKDFSHIYDSQWRLAYEQGRYFKTLIEFKNRSTGEVILVTGEHFPMRDSNAQLIGYQGVLYLQPEGEL